jgi:hypothetical protein
VNREHRLSTCFGVQVVGSAVAFLAWNGHLLTNDFARAPRSAAAASSLHNYRGGVGLRGIRDGWLPGFKMVRDHSPPVTLTALTCCDRRAYTSVRVIRNPQPPLGPSI